MNLFYSEATGLSINKNWDHSGQAYVEVVTDNGEGDLNINEIDKMIAALEFAKSETVVEETKKLVAQLHDLELNDIVSIDFHSIHSSVEGVVDVHTAGKEPRFVEFKVPRLV